MHGRRIGVGRDYVDERQRGLARDAEQAKVEISLCKNDLTINRAEAENEDLKHYKIH